MASLKHLLNLDDDSDVDSVHPPSFVWDDSGFFDETIPALPDQCWDQYIGDVFGSGHIANGYDQTYPDTATESQSLRETQHHIEQWATGKEPQLGPDLPPAEEVDVCYGTIFRAAVKLCGSMAELDKELNSATTSPIQGHALLTITRPETHYLVTFINGAMLGEVNALLEKALTNMMEQQYRLDFEVFAPIRAIRETISRATKEKDAVVRVQINVYGPQTNVAAIGREFSQHKIYLQRPDHVRGGTGYDNPHVLKLTDHQYPVPEIVVDVEEQVAERTTGDTLLKETIKDVYSSLTRNNHLRVLEGDERLKTPLLLHQKTALDFMLERENGPISDAYRLWTPIEVDGQHCHRHTVTNAICRLGPPEETGGGILADEMGMGKSLSVLALILRTLEAAHMWSKQLRPDAQDSPDQWRSRRRSSATLVVASSDLMINEWFQELDKHFAHGTRSALRTIKYHGQNRKTSPDKLCEADIIITTYHTLASEHANNKDVINDIEWYRLVLDEAHIIRRQSTTLYRTVSGIPARARWCLTGTPIQNRLEDLGSLLTFLRLEPFHSLSTFRKFIALPYDEGSKRRTLAIERFTRLLDSVCLRRGKELLHLPDQLSIIRKITLSREERIQYDQTHKTMFRAIRHQNGVFDSKSTLGMFQVQLQLRILCNHGTWQQPFSWNRRKLHLLDEREAVEASLGREGEVTCSGCRQTMPLFGTGTQFRRYAECRHVLCSECVEESSTQGQDALPTRCPLCVPLWDASKTTHRSKQTSQEDMYFRSDGRSSKMDMLMADVLANVLTTKSIIFTCWTRTLDLIQLYLRHAGLKAPQFQRIDGECPTKKREKILEDFANNKDLHILIMTTGTGAVGLNLATANRVFIVEPQWNPSVENQAIARALRLGQKQPVTVTRYVVEQTVEQDMRTLQDTKMERANLVKSR